MEILEALDLTFQHAQQVIGTVRPDQLDNKTPCPAWTVRDLLAHQIGVVAGMGAAASQQPRPDFTLAPDPAAQFAEVSAATLQAWRAPGALDRTVNGGPGPMPGRVSRARDRRGRRRRPRRWPPSGRLGRRHFRRR